MKFKEYLPWFSPDESLEACELLDEIKSMLIQLAAYGPLRKELRLQLADKARLCDDFLQRAQHPRVERAVILAVETEADKRNVKVSAVLSEAVEQFISKLNRSA